MSQGVGGDHCVIFNMLQFSEKCGTAFAMLNVCNKGTRLEE